MTNTIQFQPTAHPTAWQVDGSVVAWIALLRLGGVRQDSLYPQKFNLPMFWGRFSFFDRAFSTPKRLFRKKRFYGTGASNGPQSLAGRGSFRVADCSRHAARWF